MEQPKMFYRKTALKIFAIFAGKHLILEWLLIKRLQHRCFAMNIAKCFEEHLRTTAF